MALAADPPLLLSNPRCSKSRAAVTLLEGAGIAFVERRYLDDPLSRDELAELGKRLALGARAWCRTREAAFAEAGLDPDSSDAQILDAMVRHPILVERPILVVGTRAVVGRPPERIREILE